MNWLKSISFDDFLRRLFFAMILLCVGILVVRILRKLVKQTLEKAKLEPSAQTLILSLTSVVLYVLLALSVASAIGIDVTGAVALASVLTLSLSLALQNMLANVIGGFTLLYTRPFHTGDYVEIAAQSGTVQGINLSYTVLATPDNKVISIPNSAVVAAEIVNYSAEPTRRIAIDVATGCDVPGQKVLDALVLVGTMDSILLDPAPSAVVSGYGDGIVRYSLRVWVKTEDYWDAFYALNQRLKLVFDEQGIAMAVPQMQVQLKNGS